ncbi:MAG: patatin family protein [Deltaproteobacteria bacterium]|nr:patatin family protein [Deltaproteobacteria bacterium]
MPEVYGNNPQIVIDIMKQRKSGGITSSERKIGLIVEGGGMRGVLSAGSLLAIDLMGFRGVFDQVYATSAGGVNAAYFLSGQGKLGISVYFEDINNSKFINFYRISKIVDIDYVYDYVVTKVKPLDQSAIYNCKTDFFLSATDCEMGKSTLFDVKNMDTPVNKLLKASSALPVFYNRTIRINNNHYIDGGLAQTIPINEAIENGCTDILVLLTKLPDRYKHSPPLWMKLLFYFMIGRKFPKLQSIYGNNYEKENEDKKKVIFVNKIDKEINIATICPSVDELNVNRLTTDKNKLISGAYSMSAKTYKIFSMDEANLESIYNKEFIYKQ